MCGKSSLDSDEGNKEVPYKWSHPATKEDGTMVVASSYGGEKVFVNNFEHMSMRDAVEKKLSKDRKFFDECLEYRKDYIRQGGQQRWLHETFDEDRLVKRRDEFGRSIGTPARSPSRATTATDRGLSNGRAAAS